MLGLVLLLWIAGVAACVGAFHWSCRAGQRRLRAALVLAVLAFAIGYIGWGHLELVYSQTTNGEGWSINSRWFFLALCGLAVLSGLPAAWALGREQFTGSPPRGEDAG